jgi:hypothetical protein
MQKLNTESCVNDLNHNNLKIYLQINSKYFFFILDYFYDYLLVDLDFDFYLTV